MPHLLDVVAVRAWCSLALEALGRDRAEIDAINVYPVADGDTGTNLYLTVESAHQAVEAVFAGLGAGREPVAPTLPEVMRAMAHGALIGARGNSGTILAQLLRGMAQVLADGDSRDGDHSAGADAGTLRLALRRAAESAREAVARPVEGTILTVAASAAEAASAVDGDCATVVHAAYEGACAALDATPGQLAVLSSAGVVDAGGRGLVAVLGALSEAVSGESAPLRRRQNGARARVEGETTLECPEEPDAVGPAFEVIYLLEADDRAVQRLRTRLDTLGDSLVVVGGDGLWNVHVHVDDAGAAVEAGVEAGCPYRIRITHFALGDAHTARSSAPPRERAQRAVVAVVPGDGLADLY
ncbi:DAK2 domain-containing protein, partial [Streptomyces sp. SID14478]|uniref:DAK2 domain-containing protein n=1 Tax=Streptomyces sp. SID14478 TaxID=2706073 RepID=UPI0013DFE2DC|nr:DAK2 domain-containing protein [Streptomyces sp. SID14478]